MMVRIGSPGLIFFPDINQMAVACWGTAKANEDVASKVKIHTIGFMV
jgi:hypothetical protein